MEEKEEKGNSSSNKTRLTGLQGNSSSNKTRLTGQSFPTSSSRRDHERRWREHARYSTSLQRRIFRTVEIFSGIMSDEELSEYDQRYSETTRVNGTHISDLKGIAMWSY